LRQPKSCNGVIANGLTAGFAYSYDATFQSVATGEIIWRFGGNDYGSPSKNKAKKAWQKPVIQALSASPANRDVRVRDLRVGGCGGDGLAGCSPPPYS